MKLVDILAREMKVWPQRLGDTVGQGNSGYLHGYAGEGHPNCATTIGTATYSMCDDYRSEKVTREQWQAAVEALNPPAWNGEGMPPIGTVCLTADKGLTFRVKILAYALLSDGGTAVMCSNDESGSDRGELHAWIAEACIFRIIRTAEQIAADDREAECKQLCIDAGSPELTPGQMQTAYRLYDAGYRKQVAP